VKQKTTFIAGNFNILHPGHLRLIRFAKELGNKLIVGVYSDYIAGSLAIVPENLRLDSIKSISWVDESFIIDKPLLEILIKIKPDIVVKGKEYEEQHNPELVVIEKYGGKLVFSSGENIFSSFDLIQKEVNSIFKQKFYNPFDFIKRNNIKIDSLKKKINNFKKLQILVIGDTIIDEYINCDPLGMSQEDPTIVVTPIESKKFIGGAAIVAAHAASLGANVNYISVCGSDDSYLYLKTKLNHFNVKQFILKDESRPTTLKQRYRARGKTLLRVSHLHQGAISIKFQNKILNKVKQIITKCNLLVLSDFNYGVLPDELVNRITKLAKYNNVLVVADSQSSSQTGDISRFVGMDLITPTEREARLSIRDNESGLVVLAEKIKSKSNAKNVLLKIGEEGVLIHSKNLNEHAWRTDRIPALNQNPIDVSGAGDSMLITSSMALASKASIWEASLIGSISAAIQVSRLGNVPLNLEELSDSLIDSKFT
jgi:rfaE bifunctional protein kinase chain/domain